MRFVDAAALKSWIHDQDEIALLDIREYGQFGEEHLFFATSLPYSVLETKVDRLIPRKNVRIVLYGDHSDPNTVEASYKALTDLGYTHCHVLFGGIQSWKASGFTVFSGVNLPSKTFGELVEHRYNTPKMTAQELHHLMHTPDTDFVIIDGRPQEEFRKMNIPGSVCCPNGELSLRIHGLAPDPKTKIVINCAGRTRSIIGAQTLINLCLPNPIYALENGTQGWFLADYALEHGAERHYLSQVSDAELNLARARALRLKMRFSVSDISAADVLQILDRQQESVYFIDVRTKEEFLQDSMPNRIQHAPGGQLIQAIDQYVGVRKACIVLCDFDEIRAPTVASWLKQQGWKVRLLPSYELEKLHSALTEEPSKATFKTSKILSAPGLSEIMESESSLLVLDVRSSMDYRKQHLKKAIWSIRPYLSEQLPQDLRTSIVIMGDDARQLEWLAADLEANGYTRVWVCTASMAECADAGLTIVSSPQEPPDNRCIDYLFFVHDRHDGNKAAARQYLDWETNLIKQLDHLERSEFPVDLVSP